MRKMTSRRAYVAWVILGAFAMIFTGCAGTSKPSNFYLLRALPESEDSLTTAGGKGRPIPSCWADYASGLSGPYPDRHPFWK